MLSSVSRFLSQTPDILVIGGGPGGYAAAIRAGKLGLSTVCVEKENLMGGTCLREGCIPSKYLLNVSHKVHSANHEFNNFGIKIPGPVTVDVPFTQKKKDDVISGLSKGIEFLLKKNKADLIHGEAFINGPHEITVTEKDGKVTKFQPKNLLLATGSKLWYPNMFPVDEEIVATSRGALGWLSVPKSLTVIGGGIIGLELGSVWASLGSKVTIADMAPAIGGPSVEADAAQLLLRIMKRRGINFELGKPVESCTKTADGAVETVIGGKLFKSERALVAVGRAPNLEGFGFENLGVKMNGKVIEIDSDFKTSVPNVYAIGDIVPGPQLAHKAEEEGIACVEKIAGKHSSYNPGVIPSVLYTTPEVATVGLTRDEATKKGIKTKVSKVPYASNSRARAIMESDGYVKFVTDLENKVIGMQVVGPNAGEAIMEGAIAIKNGLTIDAIGETCHPHPTLSEAVMEAAKGILGSAIHF